MADNNTSDYVKPPQAVPPEEQLSQLKVAAKGMIHSFVDKANQASNDPANQARSKESDEFLQRDINATAQDAATSYTKALTQMGDAFQRLESAGKNIASQVGVASKETTAGAQEFKGAAREQAQQQSKDAQVKVQSGQSALQQGIVKVHDALSSGMAVANEKLQDGTATTTESKDLNHPTTLLQSLGNAISSTAQSVKHAFITPSPTANQSHATPTSTNLPVTHPPAQSVSESIGQTAAALRDAITSTWSSETPPPVRPDSTPKALPEASAKP